MMEFEENNKKKQLNRLNKMLDLADKTGSTSDLANVNDDTQYNETTTNTILHTPMEGDRILSDIQEANVSQEEPVSLFSNSLGKKMINVTKDNHIKPPMRSRNRPVSTDASSLGSELNKMISNEVSHPSSPLKNRRLPLSPRKFDLQREAKRQSLDDVQDKLSEQLEELKSIASGGDGKENDNVFNFEKPPVDHQGLAIESTESLDKFYSAANSVEEDVSMSEMSNTLAHNVGIKRASGNFKKISVSDLPQEDSRVENSVLKSYEDVTETNDAEEEDDDEYEDISEPVVETQNLKNSIKKKLNTPHKFNLSTMESLLGSMHQVNDFENLGMRDEERKYLQLLVNNLSKLTADMILDPSKYEEGLRRLKKAALALEGF
ncbi:hypothetical protein ACO0R3_000150 [Hanseniaspora guilliermondii]